MPDVTPGQLTRTQAQPSPRQDPGSVQAIITRGWNACMVQVLLVGGGEARMLVGKEVANAAAAEAVARGVAARHGVEKVELIFK
jgi:hypothetical protein